MKRYKQAAATAFVLLATPQQFSAHMRDEAVKWAKVVEVSGAKGN